MFSRSIVFAIILLTALFLSACQPIAVVPAAEPTAAPPSADVPAPAGDVPAPATEATKLKVVILPFISFAPYFIAQEEGYFAEQGLEVELVNLVQNQDAVTALISGEVDVAAGLMTAGILNAMARDAGIRVVADKGYIDPNGCPNIAIVGSKSLIEANPELTAEVLRGKKYRGVPASWNDYFADKVFNTIGLSSADFEDVALPSPEQEVALTNGALDIAVNNEPWVTRFQKAGHMPILSPVTEALPDSQSAIMLYGRSLLEDKFDAGNRFMVAYLQAVRQYNEGKTERNQEILSKYMQLDPATMQEMCWPTLRADGSLNHESILDFQDWAVERGFSEQILPIEQIVDERSLNAANQVLGASP